VSTKRLQDQEKHRQYAQQICDILFRAKHIVHEKSVQVVNPAEVSDFLSTIRSQSNERTISSARAAYAQKIISSLSEISYLSSDHLEQIVNTLLHSGPVLRSVRFGATS
jgi:DNA-directed RNA polymerase specialized sigma54-like protein